jgi:predicted phosphodiesterase
MRGFETAVVMGDLHIPFEDKKAVKVALDVAEDINPDIIILNGDVSDCWEISRFTKRLDVDADLRDEIDQTRIFLMKLRNRFRKSRIIYIYGNHEHRWSTWIANNARELHGLRGLTLKEQFDCTEEDIEVVYSGNKESSWLWGRLLIGHFDRVHKHSGYTAKNLLDQKGISLIQAHTHRGGSSFRRMWDRDLGAWEGFCLCDRNPQYVDHPNWQLGFLAVTKSKLSDYFHVEEYPIVPSSTKHATYYKGRLYTS